MDQQIQNLNTLLKEDKLDLLIIGKSPAEVERLFNLPLESKCEDEYVYILKKYFFGFFKKKLYLFFYKGRVREYYLGF